MDIQKEREAFQECYKTSRDYKFYVRHEMSDKQIFEFKGGKYVVNCVNHGWWMWQAAKAQANKQFANFIDQAIEDSACADERRSLQVLLEDFQDNIEADKRQGQKRVSVNLEDL